jgi:hypothetical protein
MKYVLFLFEVLLSQCAHYHASPNGVAGQIGCPADKIEILDHNFKGKSFEPYLTFRARCEDRYFVCSSRSGWVVCTAEWSQPLSSSSPFLSHAHSKDLTKKQPPFAQIDVYNHNFDSLDAYHSIERR